MNRNFINSLSAVAAVAVVLMVALIYAVPTGPAEDFPDKHVLSAKGLGESGDPSPPPSGRIRASGGGSGPMARTLAIPYFSLVTRG
ncbi:MAG: hypothetical protein ABIY56_06195 [Dokdonella sp.]